MTFPILIAAALIATPGFPGVIQEELQLPEPPRCTVCHATNSGGAGTVVKPFGVYLVSRGLKEGNNASLRNALRAAAGERHISGSGLPDIEALVAGEDPNGPTPSYGCSSAGPATWLPLLAGLVAWAWARRRSRAQRPSGDGTANASDSSLGAVATSETAAIR